MAKIITRISLILLSFAYFQQNAQGSVITETQLKTLKKDVLIKNGTSIKITPARWLATIRLLANGTDQPPAIKAFILKEIKKLRKQMMQADTIERKKIIHELKLFLKNAPSLLPEKGPRIISQQIMPNLNSPEKDSSRIISFLAHNTSLSLSLTPLHATMPAALKELLPPVPLTDDIEALLEYAALAMKKTEHVIGTPEANRWFGALLVIIFKKIAVLKYKTLQCLAKAEHHVLLNKSQQAYIKELKRYLTAITCD